MIFQKLELGKQLGIDRRIEKEDGFYWYSYAVQKIEDTYIVYECEIAEDNMAMEEYEYENINRYLSIAEVRTGPAAVAYGNV
ncbi:MAG: hypothetical protein NC548_51630 [Lachnospiraceae bacterium]|nr:hypothetical protein [Lachnospiraceae bacterium]